MTKLSLVTPDCAALALVVAVLINVLWLVLSEDSVERTDEMTRLSETALLSAVDAFVVAVLIRVLCEPFWLPVVDRLVLTNRLLLATPLRAVESVGLVAVLWAVLMRSDWLTFWLARADTSTNSWASRLEMTADWLRLSEDSVDRTELTTALLLRTPLRATESGAPAEACDCTALIKTD